MPCSIMDSGMSVELISVELELTYARGRVCVYVFV